MALNRTNESAAELGCKWHFKAGMNFSMGATDAAGQNFDGSWDSLIRECIQNSLDAVLDKSKPVTVQIKFSRFNMSSYRNFFGLKEHIQACLDTFPDTAGPKYGPMLNLFNDLSRPGTAMGYLQISDYNTKGMAYDPDNDSCNFSAFVRGVGVHGGDQSSLGRGGSFGLGKSTIFTMSPIRTMLVSTMTEQGQYVFEGVSTLTTHRMNGEKYSHVGFYDNEEGEPITDYDRIPARFRRKPDDNGCITSGTDIMVMGRDVQNGDIEDITKSVLTHYWLAVLRGKLIVKIFDADRSCNEIDASTLSELMDNYFSNPVDNYRNRIHPRPYYDAVVKADIEPGCICVKETLPRLGEVELYLIKNRDAKNDRIAFFRMPCMMVMRKSTSQFMLNINNFGVYGTIVCTNEKGDRLLKHLENPAHDEWNEKNWREPLTNRISSQASATMEELRKFLAAQIEEFCKLRNRTSMKMLGAGKYLYTFSDMVEGEDSPEIPQNLGIIATDSFTESETGVRNSDFIMPPDINETSSPSILRRGQVINEAGLATIQNEPEETGKRKTTAVVTPPKKKHNKKTKRNTGGNTPKEAVVSDQPAAVLIDVDFKVCALREKIGIVHNICIISEENIPSATILFTSKREDGRLDNELEITDTFGIGNFNGMEMRGVSLSKGSNMIKVRFNDDLKHILDMNVTKMLSNF